MTAPWSMGRHDTGPRGLCKRRRAGAVYPRGVTVHHKDQCPCGSGKRYKHCHLPIHQTQRRRALVIAASAAGFLAVVAIAWAVWANRPKSPSAAAGGAGGAASAQGSAATPSADTRSNAFGGVQPGVAGRSPTPAQQGGLAALPNKGALAPGENPKPWEYDVANNRYYDPRPGHQHWHTGAPPADPNAPAPTVTVTTPGVTATTASGTPVKVIGTSTVQVQPAPPPAKGTAGTKP